MNMGWILRNLAAGRSNHQQTQQCSYRDAGTHFAKLNAHGTPEIFANRRKYTRLAWFAILSRDLVSLSAV